MVKIVIIGTGPCGLGAAWRIQELCDKHYLGIELTILESQASVGGLASSFAKDGFIFDLGAHVAFSHYNYFTKMIDTIFADDPDELLVKQRAAFVWMCDRFIPYPLQNNIWRLPANVKQECFDGVLDRSLAVADDFETFLAQTYGAGLLKYFMGPYNLKVWAHPLCLLNKTWVGDRVAPIDLKQLIRQELQQTDETKWGPNATFRFPKHNGTGSIWERVAQHLKQQPILFNKEVTQIKDSTVFTQDGSAYKYDYLLSTMPLEHLLTALNKTNIPTRDVLLYSSTHIVGIGIKGDLPACLKDKSWIYFPENNVIFYRLAIFSNFSSCNAPEGCWSVQCEISESPYQMRKGIDIVQETIDSLLRIGLLLPEHNIVCKAYRFVERGYPTPFLNLEAIVRPLLNDLRKSQIYSRGRFGARFYSVSNQDHCFMQGVESVDHMLFRTPELTLEFPNTVNSPSAFMSRDL